MVEVVREKRKEDFAEERRSKQRASGGARREKQAQQRGPLSLPGLRWGNIRFHATRHSAAILVYAVLQRDSVVLPPRFLSIRSPIRITQFRLRNISCSSILLQQTYQGVVYKIHKYDMFLVYHARKNLNCYKNSLPTTRKMKLTINFLPMRLDWYDLYHEEK